MIFSVLDAFPILWLIHAFLKLWKDFFRSEVMNLDRKRRKFLSNYGFNPRI